MWTDTESGSEQRVGVVNDVGESCGHGMTKDENEGGQLNLTGTD